MAAPLIDPLLSKLRQTTTTAARAANVLRSAFPSGDSAAGTNSIAVPLPRRDVPTYVMANQRPQPWELLPMKAAAMAQYPNFFNNSCTFFGSIKRDVVNGVPFCLLRPSRLSLDMAKVVRNLGIVDGFEVVQRPGRLGAHDFVWTADQAEPEHLYDLALFRQKLIRLHLRTDMYSLLPAPGGRGGGSGGGGASSAGPGMPPSAQLAPAFGLLPLSVKNVSKASQPVLMYPRQLEMAAGRVASGVFVCYHPELGVITDAVAQQYDVPALVAAHVGLPLSQVAAIRGALRAKKVAEAGKPLRHVTQLKDWNMVEMMRQRMMERRAALEGQGEGAASTSSPALEPWLQELRDTARRKRDEAIALVETARKRAQGMEDGALAWQVVRSGLLEQPQRPGQGAGSGAGAEDRGHQGRQEERRR